MQHIIAKSSLAVLKMISLRQLVPFSYVAVKSLESMLFMLFDSLNTEVVLFVDASNAFNLLNQKVVTYSIQHL